MEIVCLLQKVEDCKMYLPPNARGLIRGAIIWIWLSIGVLPSGFSIPAEAQTQHPPATQAPAKRQPDSAGTGPTVAGQSTQQLPGSINGTLIVQTGALAVGAHVQLTREDQSPTAGDIVRRQRAISPLPISPLGPSS